MFIYISGEHNFEVLKYTSDSGKVYYVFNENDPVRIVCQSNLPPAVYFWLWTLNLCSLDVSQVAKLTSQPQPASLTTLTLCCLLLVAAFRAIVFHFHFVLC